MCVLISLWDYRVHALESNKDLIILLNAEKTVFTSSLK